MPDEKRGRDYELSQFEMPEKYEFRRIIPEESEYQPGEGKSAFAERLGELMRTSRIELGLRRPGKSYLIDEIRLRPDLDWPVRVGDVVRIIDITGHAGPQPGHVVDITSGWVTVGCVFGRRALFYAQTGYMVGDYRWQLEPYSKVPFDG